MINRTLAGIVMLSMLAAANPLHAQLRADPGTVINGRVAVRVYVTLSDEETSYAPMGGVHLRFFRTTADTVVVVQTDDAGTATALLAPGEYRLMSTSPVDWKGARYSWNKLVQVRAGIPTIELTAALAERDATVAAAPSSLQTASLASNGAMSSDVAALRKDPSMATMLSFFAPGSGQIYAGERGKGGALLALSTVGVIVAAKSLSCAAASDCESSTVGMTLGAAGMLAFFGSWVYGIVDAGDAARRFNLRHGLVASDVRPVIAPAGRGRTQLGLSVALPR